MIVKCIILFFMFLFIWGTYEYFCIRSFPFILFLWTQPIILWVEIDCQVFIIFMDYKSGFKQ